MNGLSQLDAAPAPPEMAVVATFLRFGAHLRERGLPANPGSVLELLRAMPLLDLHQPDDLYYAARCLLIDRAEHMSVFDEAFLEFWQARQSGAEPDTPPPQLPRMSTEASDEVGLQPPSRSQGTAPAERLPGDSTPDEREQAETGRGQGAGLLSYSPDELLREKDFGVMTADELRACRRLLSEMRWDVARRRSRRLIRAVKGRHVDWLRSQRLNIGNGGALLELERRERKIVKRRLVVLADVSGSMDRYTRPVLHLVHTMSAGHGRVEAFVFGTRLTRITRQLTGRDPEAALHRLSLSVHDWAGGTRIGEALGVFNRRWARRVLGHGAVVIVVSDGWDRGDPLKVAAAMAQLQRRSHRLIWLNPALGGPTVRPMPLGMLAARPYVDDLLPARNLNDLAQVGRLLAELSGARPVRNAARPTSRAVTQR
ncbi:MAG: VWA domain-containing protein [Candidatus Dormibacteria bacterium]